MSINPVKRPVTGIVVLGIFFLKKEEYLKALFRVVTGPFILSASFCNYKADL